MPRPIPGPPSRSKDTPRYTQHRAARREVTESIRRNTNLPYWVLRMYSSIVCQVSLGSNTSQFTEYLGTEYLLPSNRVKSRLDVRQRVNSEVFSKIEGCTEGCTEKDTQTSCMERQKRVDNLCCNSVAFS